MTCLQAQQASRVPLFQGKEEKPACGMLHSFVHYSAVNSERKHEISGSDSAKKITEVGDESHVSFPKQASIYSLAAGVVGN